MDRFLDDLPDLDLPIDDHKRTKSAKQPLLYDRAHCPQCGSRRVPVYSSSHLPIRYHRCRDCGCTFKSIEVKP